MQSEMSQIASSGAQVNFLNNSGYEEDCLNMSCCGNFSEIVYINLPNIPFARFPGLCSKSKNVSKLKTLVWRFVAK